MYPPPCPLLSLRYIILDWIGLARNTKSTVVLKKEKQKQRQKLTPEFKEVMLVVNDKTVAFLHTITFCPHSYTHPVVCFFFLRQKKVFDGQPILEGSRLPKEGQYLLKFVPVTCCRLHQTPYSPRSLPSSELRDRFLRLALDDT